MSHLFFSKCEVIHAWTLWPLSAGKQSIYGETASNMKRQPKQTPRKLVITVNGREIEANPGTTLLETLIAENIHVPHLCYDPRLSDPNANCGLCVVELVDRNRVLRACKTPVRDGMNIRTNTPELTNYRRTRIEELLSDHNADCLPPCQQTCPAGIDIQAYLRQVANGNIEAALRIIKDRNPFPVACGRVCPHPCEAACRRNLVDSPVGINYVKRLVADCDQSNDKPFIPTCKDASGKKIAIVGGGPSGLSAAYYSAINGHNVTVFEHQQKAGGMLRYGIPDYRLPQDKLDREIECITELGVKIITGRSLGSHLRLEHLQKDFDAVYLAVGSWQASSMRVDGEQSQGVWPGINYLEQIAKGKKLEIGDKVVIVGGGNTAVDCARTALRTGAETTLLYRRTRDEMPAEPYEIEAAIEEGVNMLYLAAPTRLESDECGRVCKLHCVKMELGEPDRSGRRRPIPVDGSDFEVNASSVIGAIGQKTNTSYLWDDLPVALNRWGDIEINGKTMQTSADKIFAGGDCVTGPATVIQAVAAGRRAADAINDFLTIGYVREATEDYSCSRGRLEDLPRYEFELIPKTPRATMPELAPKKRAESFTEVETGLEKETAINEAARCLECGCAERYNCKLRNTASEHHVIHEPDLSADLRFRPVVNDHPFIIRDHNKCISCGRCVAACNEIEGPAVLGLYLKEGKFCVGTKSGMPLSDTDCVSCGQCVTACPCGALDYRRESDQVFKALNNSDKNVIAYVAPAVRSLICSEFDISFDKASPFMAGLLKKMGFNKVFDFVFAADLTIVEETTEFLTRVNSGERLPQFTSCCPGWVNFVERRYPELIPLLSSCKSPQQMMGATVKNHFPQWAGSAQKPEDIFVVSIVPCLAKKHEAAREEFAPNGTRDVDAVLTTTELFEMVRMSRINTADIIPGEFDDPYREVSSAGVLFGASGGVAEAALRMGVEKLSGASIDGMLDFHDVRGLEGVKSASLKIGDRKLKLAVVSGLKHAEPIIQRLIEGVDTGYDLIEVMACPGGCIAGAGHPVPDNPCELVERQNVLLNIDKVSHLRKSHENPDIRKLYDDFYKEANSELAHRLLHTEYFNRKRENYHDIMTRSDSAYSSRKIHVCVGDHCFKRGSHQVLTALQDRIHELKVEHFIQVIPRLCVGGHTMCTGVFVTVDGKRIDESRLDNLDTFILGLIGKSGDGPCKQCPSSTCSC